MNGGWDRQNCLQSYYITIEAYKEVQNFFVRFFARSDCVHEQVAKLGPVSRVAGVDCECPLYCQKKCNRYKTEKRCTVMEKSEKRKVLVTAHRQDETEIFEKIN